MFSLKKRKHRLNRPNKTKRSHESIRKSLDLWHFWWQITCSENLVMRLINPIALETTQFGCIIHGAWLRPHMSLFLVEPSIAESDWPHLLQCATKTQDNCQEKPEQGENGTMTRCMEKSAWRFVQVCWHALSWRICRGFLRGFLHALHSFSVAFSAFIGPFCRVRYFLWSSLIVHTWHPPILLVCMQPGLPLRVSTKCLCMCSWVNRNKLNWAICGMLNTCRSAENWRQLENERAKKVVTALVRKYWPSPRNKVFF